MLFSRKKKEPREAVIVNLDYDKLAAAILNAQKKASEEEFEKDNTAFFSKTLLQFSFGAVGVLLVLFVGYSVYMLFSSIHPATQIIAIVVLCFMALVYAICSFGMIKSIGRIKDRNYLVSFFSSLVALTALIVAIVK